MTTASSRGKKVNRGKKEKSIVVTPEYFSLGKNCIVIPHLLPQTHQKEDSTQ